MREKATADGRDPRRAEMTRLSPYAEHTFAGKPHIPAVRKSMTRRSTLTEQARASLVVTASFVVFATRCEEVNSAFK
jgi:hypothetical protein